MGEVITFRAPPAPAPQLSASDCYILDEWRDRMTSCVAGRINELNRQLSDASPASRSELLAMLEEYQHAYRGLVHTPDYTSDLDGAA
jgi:hypothetical protein